MSYYILPKNNTCIKINYTIKNHDIPVPIYTSFSIHNYYKNEYDELVNITKTNDISFNNIEKILEEFHVHEYIMTMVPGTKFSVSKLKTNSNFFYELFEICISLNCFENFNNVPITCLHVGDNYLDTQICLEILRDKMKDTIFYINDKNYTLINIDTVKHDFIFYEISNNDMSDLNVINMNSYTLQLIDAVMIILKKQKENGIAIIQLNHVFYKPIIDILYIICSMFSKTYIVKPNATNIITFNKYLVCKGFLIDEWKDKNVYSYYYDKLSDIKKEIQENNGIIHSIIDDELSCYFINKIDDINIIIGQQQLEYISQITNIFKNNNKAEKIEFIKKNNIQKTVNWCEKFKIPCNKFLDKTNIFYTYE